MMAELLFEVFRGKDFTRGQWEIAIAVTAVLLVIFAIVVNGSKIVKYARPTSA